MCNKVNAFFLDANVNFKQLAAIKKAITRYYNLQRFFFRIKFKGLNIN